MTEVTKKVGRPTKAEVQRRRELAALEEFTPEPVEAAPKIRTLDEMSIPELLERCYNVYRIPVTPDMAGSKEILLQAIRRQTERGTKQDFALDGRDVDPDAIPPGFAKIILHKEQHTGALNFPYPFGVNGYICAIPRDIPVLVPIKIVDGPLKDAKETVRIPIQGRPGEYKTVERHVQPYQELGRTPGPDPRPNKTKAYRFAPRKAFRDAYGHWPSAAQLDAALRDKTISLEKVG